MHLVNISVKQNYFFYFLLFFISIQEVNGQDCVPPEAPVIEIIVQPTCESATGNVTLSGLPRGEWILTRFPDGVVKTGTDRTTVVTDLAPGTYTFIVALVDDDNDCPSVLSSEVVINEQPPTPSVPVHTVDCTLGFDNAVITVSSPLGADLEYRLNNGTYQSSPSFTGVANGHYTITVRNSVGCTATGNPFQVDCPCVNGPVLNLSSTEGTICVSNPITISGNTFTNATRVTLTENGSGTLSPSSAEVTPFSFTYTPSSIDAGRTVNITIATDNPLGSPCQAATATYILRITAGPPAPSIGTITQPTCSVPTGDVTLNGLPPLGTWILTRLPDNVITPGTGTSTTIPGLLPGTYSFRVTDAATCISVTSASVTINVQPATPVVPVVGTITQPTCTEPEGSVVLSGLPSGLWTINPGGIQGSGGNRTIPDLTPGTYNFTVTSSAGCISQPTGNVVINPQPPSPPAPVSTIDCSLGFNYAVITVSSPIGTGLSYRLDNGTFQDSPVFTEVVNGDHTITVRNSSGCLTTGTSFTVSCSCVNGPVLALSSPGGTTCGITPLTVSGNTFGGNATIVSITENGSGSVSPSQTTSPLFAFTYTPSASDAGKTVTITVRTNNPLGSPCEEAVATYRLEVNVTPAAPSVGIIIQPSCTQPTGSVALSNLPATGTWTLTLSPGGTEITGTGRTFTVAGLVQGTYIFTVTNEDLCTSPSSASVVINALPMLPAAPVAGTVTHPTCSLSTGSVELSGLPGTGSWTVITSPGEMKTTGSGATARISGLSGGTYTFSVVNSTGCTSTSSSSVVINQQPGTPVAPVPGVITQPGCLTSIGSVVLNNLPAAGTWTLTRFPGTITTTGSGNNAIVTGLTPGVYNYTVTNQSGCVSAASANITIAAPPPIPAAPVIGSITTPTCILPSGSVVLSGLPVAGSWNLTRLPGGSVSTGNGAGTTISDLQPGTYTFTVANSYGCISASTANVIIPPIPGAPTLTITDPAPVCAPATVDLRAAAITAGSTQGLTLSYWLDSRTSIPLNRPESAGAGIFYIKGTNSSLCSDVKPVNIKILQQPVAIVDAVSSMQILKYVFNSDMKANQPRQDEIGTWSLLEGMGRIAEPSKPSTVVTDLSIGINRFLWTVSNNVCPPATDTVQITVHDIIIPSLITPNNDNRNEFFIIESLLPNEKTELLVFSRRGVRVFKDENYDNTWDGTDDNGDPLASDTYFYVVRWQNGRSRTGFIVIRR